MISLEDYHVRLTFQIFKWMGKKEEKNTCRSKILLFLSFFFQFLLLFKAILGLCSFQDGVWRLQCENEKWKSNENAACAFEFKGDICSKLQPLQSYIQVIISQIRTWSIKINLKDTSYSIYNKCIRICIKMFSYQTRLSYNITC